MERFHVHLRSQSLHALALAKQPKRWQRFPHFNLLHLFLMFVASSQPLAGTSQVGTRGVAGGSAPRPPAKAWGCSRDALGGLGLGCAPAGMGQRPLRKLSCGQSSWVPVSLQEQLPRGHCTVEARRAQTSPLGRVAMSSAGQGSWMAGQSQGSSSVSASLALPQQIK